MRTTRTAISSRCGTTSIPACIERAAYLDSVRVAEGPENVLLLHAGDFSQGTTYFSELGGNLEIQALNAFKYDVVTLGNHEFDNGLEDLGRRLSSLEMPVVVCNYDFSPFEAGKYIKPYVILEKAGLKIGVIGVLCDLKSMVAGDIAERVPEFPMVETVPFAHVPGGDGLSPERGRRSDADRPGRLLRGLLGTDRLQSVRDPGGNHDDREGTAPSRFRFIIQRIYSENVNILNIF